MTIHFGKQKKRTVRFVFFGFHCFIVPLLRRFPCSVIPLLPPQFYGFADDENERDDGEQAGKEKGERFAVKAVARIEAVTSTAR